MPTKSVANFRGIQIGSLKPLKRVLTKWRKLNEDNYWFRDNDDSPWWENERTSLGVLSAAIWLSRGKALEEVSVAKVPVIENARKYTGHCDIWFDIGQDCYVAEAKQCWPILIENPQAAMQLVKSELENACQDTRQIQDWDYSRIGIVFASPKVHGSRQQRNEELLHQSIRGLQGIENITLAWTFPKLARNLRPNNVNRDYSFPGVALLMCPVGQ